MDMELAISAIGTLAGLCVASFALREMARMPQSRPDAELVRSFVTNAPRDRLTNIRKPTQ